MQNKSDICLSTYLKPSITQKTTDQLSCSFASILLKIWFTQSYVTLFVSSFFDILQNFTMGVIGRHKMSSKSVSFYNFVEKY